MTAFFSAAGGVRESPKGLLEGDKHASQRTNTPRSITSSYPRDCHDLRFWSRALQGACLYEIRGHPTSVAKRSSSPGVQLEMLI